MNIIKQLKCLVLKIMTNEVKRNIKKIIPLAQEKKMKKKKIVKIIIRACAHDCEESICASKMHKIKIVK